MLPGDHHTERACQNVRQIERLNRSSPNAPDQAETRSKLVLKLQESDLMIDNQFVCQIRLQIKSLVMFADREGGFKWQAVTDSHQ